MLSLIDSNSRFGRRGFLRAGTLGAASGALGLGGLNLADLLQAKALGAEGSGSVLRDKSVVFLFMQGGPSQFETFDPKPEAPTGVRCATGTVSTAIPGVSFGDTFPRLAKLADRLAVVRNFVAGNGNHDIKPLVSPSLNKASLGAAYARVAGPVHPQTGIPRSALLYPRTVDTEGSGGERNFGNHGDPGPLGQAYAPFIPGVGPLNDDMRLNLDRNRLDDRRSLLAGVDRLRRSLDHDGQLSGLDKFQEQAFEVLLGSASEAFDVRKEDAKTIERYDTAPLVRPDQISRKWNNYKRYVDHAKSLGKLLLLARRLCERGCGFVTVTTDFVWDNHADVNNAGVVEGMRYAGAPFDHAVSTFLEDVFERGLSEKILLVCCGEMGRTPRVNKNGGRDHWGNLAPLILSGGGVAGGKVVGRSTRDGGTPDGPATSIDNLVGTLSHTLFDVGQLRLQRQLPTFLLDALTTSEPIADLS